MHTAAYAEAHTRGGTRARAPPPHTKCGAPVTEAGRRPASVTVSLQARKRAEGPSSSLATLSLLNPFYFYFFIFLFFPKMGPLGNKVTEIR